METLRFGKKDIRVDGGVIDVLPLKPIFKKIKVKNYEKNEIHVIGLSPLKISPSRDPIKRKIIDVTKRSVGILVNEIYKNDLETAKNINEDLKSGIPRESKKEVKLFQYFPDIDICDSLDFRRETIDEGIKIGRKKAEEVLREYPAT